MRFKLDENLGEIGREVLESAGHDVSTIAQQSMGGVADQDLYEACRAHGRALVTLDRDFGEVLRFPPRKHPWHRDLELPRASLASFHRRADKRAISWNLSRSMAHLWIIEAGRLRIHETRS